MSRVARLASGGLTLQRFLGTSVNGRVVLVACLLAVAGCSSAPADAPTPSETVTPAPVPATETPTPEPTGMDAPGLENGTVDGETLGAMHANTLGVPHTRTVSVRIETRNRTLLDYRTNRTFTGNSFRLTRTYRGPATARFVPDSESATMALGQLYRDEDGASRRQVVDGTLRTDGGSTPRPRLVPAVTIDDVGYIATLLDGAVVTSRTPAQGYVLSNDGVEAAATTLPGFLRNPRDLEVYGRLRETGRVSRLVVGYRATLDGQAVTVVQDVRWHKPTVNESTPAWVDD